jgi:hypothetical protein
MHVKKDFALFAVNYASDFAVETTYMAWTLAKTTFASAPTRSLLYAALLISSA